MAGECANYKASNGVIPIAQKQWHNNFLTQNYLSDKKWETSYNCNSLTGSNNFTRNYNYNSSHNRLMKTLESIEMSVMEQIEGDYTPLYNIVREFSGFEKQIPSEKEFYDTLNFLRYLIGKHHVKY